MRIRLRNLLIAGIELTPWCSVQIVLITLSSCQNHPILHCRQIQRQHIYIEIQTYWIFNTQSKYFICFVNMSGYEMGITFNIPYLSACYEMSFFAHSMWIILLKPCCNARLANRAIVVVEISHQGRLMKCSVWVRKKRTNTQSEAIK